MSVGPPFRLLPLNEKTAAAAPSSPNIPATMPPRLAIVAVRLDVAGAGFSAGAREAETVGTFAGLATDRLAIADVLGLAAGLGVVVAASPVVLAIGLVAGFFAALGLVTAAGLLTAVLGFEAVAGFLAAGLVAVFFDVVEVFLGVVAIQNSLVSGR